MLLGGALAAVIAAVLVVALADARTAGPPAGSDWAAAVHVDVALRMAFDDGAGDRRSASLRCAGSTARMQGYLAGPDGRRKCRRARGLGPLPAERPDSNRLCTQVYGGPQTARVEGRIDDRPVVRRFSRRDGCEIADWDRAAILLPRIETPAR